MIRVELIKLIRRPRTWVIIGMLVALPTLVAILLAITDLGPRPGTGPPFLSAVLSDGTLFPLAALGVVLPLFLPIAVAVLGGDAIAGETQTGTLRYLLVRPVGRTHLLLAKLVTVVAFVVLAVLVVSAVVLRRGPAAARPGAGSRDGEPERVDAHPGGADRPDRAGPGVRDHLHARGGRRRAVPVHPDHVLDRGGAGHGRGADRLDRAARAGRGRGDASRSCRPATGWRSSTCSATRSCGTTWSAGWSCSSATCWSSAWPPGRTSAPRTSPTDRPRPWPRRPLGGSAGDVGSAYAAGRPPSAAASAASVTGSPGSSPWLGRRSRADVLDQHVERAVQRRRVDRRHHLVAAGPHRRPRRPVGRLVPGVQPAQQVAVREPAARRRSGSRRRARGRARPGWCRGAASPRVSTRRARAAPPWSRTQSRATTPPAE